MCLIDQVSVDHKKDNWNETKKQEERKEMFKMILVVLVWIIALICLQIMKKIQPEDKIYPIWTVVICVLLTAFVAWHIFGM